jgi:hypothetical protein
MEFRECQTVADLAAAVESNMIALRESLTDDNSIAIDAFESMRCSFSNLSIRLRELELAHKALTKRVDRITGSY